MPDRVLLTGISGFLGGHIALALIEAGYAVRGSLRDPNKADAVRRSLSAAGADISRLEFVTLDLMSDTGWREAMASCRHLLHTASPLMVKTPRWREELIEPALEGTRRAVGAALDAGIDRIVLTSSMAAIAYGHPAQQTQFGAADWTKLDGRPVNAYTESKTRAERLAWQMVEAAGRGADLVAINPGVVLGPLLDDDPGTSAVLIQRLLQGRVPAIPDIGLVLVHVRDVAAAHVAALTAPGGMRLPMGERTMNLGDIVAVLRDAVPERADRLPRLHVPDWAVRLIGLFNRDVAGNTGELGRPKTLDATAAIALLGRPLTPAPQAIVDTARSLLARQLV